jgi:signal transduction histidine kinase
VKKFIPFEFWLSLAYVVLGALWILFSDNLAYRIASSPKQLLIISTYKGWLYMLVTGILLYFFVRKQLKKRAELYNRLYKANLKATESDRLKTAFLSNLSHYIRTPMNSILGFVELLKDRGIDAEKQQLFLSYIDQRSHHLLQTLNNIIDISKIQEGQMTVCYESFSVNELLLTLSKWAKVEIERRRKDIKFEIMFGCDPGKDQLYSDHDKVYHILSNLISNAINFTQSGIIRVGYTSEAGGLLFYVRDSGCGISEEKQKQMFNGLMVGEHQLQMPNEGSGLGLFLSAKLAIIIGGRLWLEHTGVEGSTFCFSIPNQKNPIDFS